MFKIYSTFSNPERLSEKVEEDFPGKDLIDVKEFKIYKNLVPKLQTLEEFCSVRFDKDGGIKIPCGWDGWLGLIETSPDDKEYRKHIGTIRIPMIVVAHTPDFPEGAAICDEYNSKIEMLDDLKNIYGRRPGNKDILVGNFISDVIIR